ncbi:hypothetical protein V1477_018779 [Vespula maculifrons]|uniref:Uncharacterized protein n=1 Tax=Vespula maculifrons TaxID=7453 RepID=A0ABD2AWD2_VESMC
MRYCTFVKALMCERRAIKTFIFKNIKCKLTQIKRLRGLLHHVPFTRLDSQFQSGIEYPYEI